MAKMIGALCTSHVPAIGVAIDQGMTAEPYWNRCLMVTGPPVNGLSNRTPTS